MQAEGIDDLAASSGMISHLGNAIAARCQMKPGTRVPLPSAIAKIYEAVAELKGRYPGRPFTPDGHLVGSIGEVVAREVFKFDLYPPSNKGHDAKCEVRGDVEIKITAGSNVAFRGDCNHLIVLQIVSSHEAEIVYDGPGAPVLAVAGKVASNGQRRASISRIRALAREQA
jgi:hypothetical protein